MNKSLYKILYVIQRIINLPTLPIAIPVGIVWAMCYGIYLIKGKQMNSVEAMLYTQQKSIDVFKSVFFQVNIKGDKFPLSHIGIMFWIVLLWFLL
jgi:hypothetical protein